MTTTGTAVCALVLVLASLFGWRRAARDGRLRTADRRTRLTPEELGAPLGERATLVQFSTEHCGPCRPTRRLLGEVATAVPGVAHIDLDADRAPALVHRLNVLRTPTVLVLDPAGVLLHRSTGVPRRAELLTALGAD
ncbi:thioredoxin family protein [Kitasatospora viridis]|uniref:Thiol-disulfide isomerase/thioredoxin n=1 Tax=Kitasatospora viridis TaxID=281105 RepID=A0A561UPH5_9ACTN|nr:thioredoxin family protein [Kitasatospora viridis]TWG01250.1 thiol-disulfide isomerase/thioredoxin [Kitasatospora viridis]